MDALNFDRKLFETLKKNFEGVGAVPEPSYLRVEQILSNSKGKYIFDLKKNGNETLTEVKLDRNDVFVVTKLGVFLVAEKTAEPGRALLQTYPNLTEFAATTNFDPEDLNAIYSGWLSLKIGSKVNINNLSMQEFLYIPESQKTVTIKQSQYSLDAATHKPAQVIMLRGDANVEMTVEHPTWSGIQVAATASGYVNKLVLMPFGFLIKNGTVK